MKKYQHILAAVDVFEDRKQALESSVYLAKLFEAELSLMHVVIHSLYNSYGFLGEIDVEQTMLLQAKQKMQAFSQQYSIPETNQIIKIGHPKLDILESARERGVDLIVAGSHHHHVLGLLGSTASAIVNNAHCDVLLVKEDEHLE